MQRKPRGRSFGAGDTTGTKAQMGRQRISRTGTVIARVVAVVVVVVVTSTTTSTSTAVSTVAGGVQRHGIVGTAHL